MNKPPKTIDGAIVIYWAWSGENPFGVISTDDSSEVDKVYGLAICKYEGSSTIYRLACSSQWETLNDAAYDNIELAKQNVPAQYRNVQINWNVYDYDT